MKIYKPNFEKRAGIIPVIVQDVFFKDVLMLVYTNEECFLETLKTGEAVYYSTSRQKRWKKGEESGNTQRVRKILIDCDGDALIYLVEQNGEGACHTGAVSCFFRTIGGNTQFTGAKDLGEKEFLTSLDISLLKVGYELVNQGNI